MEQSKSVSTVSENTHDSFDLRQFQEVEKKENDLMKRRSRIVPLDKPILEETENSFGSSEEDIEVDFSASILDVIKTALHSSVPTSQASTDANSFATKEKNKEKLYNDMLKSAKSGSKESFMEIIDELIKIENNNANFNYQDDDGNTALHMCALEGTKRIAEVLVQLEANVNIQNKKGQTAIHLSAEGFYFN